jgi:hypothetical protein
VTVSPAYVAGFLDGEGCIGIYKYSKGYAYRYRVRFTNANKEALDLIQSQYGGYIRSERTPRGDNVIHRLDIEKKDLVTKICDDVKDHVVVKKDQIEMMLDCLKGKTTPEHAGWKLRGMKRVDHVQNLDALGLDYLETERDCRSSKGLKVWDLDSTALEQNSDA